jgi:hypothetical protein
LHFTSLSNPRQIDSWLFTLISFRSCIRVNWWHYCSLQKAKTSVVKRNLNPVWNEELKLSVPQQYGPLKLVRLLGTNFLTINFGFKITFIKTSHKIFLSLLQPASVWPWHAIEGRQNGRGWDWPAADD